MFLKIIKKIHISLYHCISLYIIVYNTYNLAKNCNYKIVTIKLFFILTCNIYQSIRSNPIQSDPIRSNQSIHHLYNTPVH